VARREGALRTSGKQEKHVSGKGKSMDQHGKVTQKEREVADQLFHSKYDDLGDREKHVARHLAERTHIARNTSQEFEEQLTFGQRIADRVAAFGGSWTFISMFGAVLLLWVLLNSFLLLKLDRTFDPYPYILLNLVLSMLAAIQAPVILMSQNRQAHRDRLDAEHDYEVNLKAELEIMALHEKVDLLREKQWADLVAIQREQLSLLTQLVEDARKTQ
jgi:uncharacterized membrane protein